MDSRVRSRTDEVIEAVRRRLASRALAAGDKLPSVRSFAASLGVSPSTVVEAYDRLVAEGLIRSRRGSGFYVAGAMAPMSLAEAAPRRDRAFDPFWVSRQSLDAAGNEPKPGCGWLPPDWMPNQAIRRALRQLAKAPDAVLDEYGNSRGSLALRRHLVRQFAEEGLETGADQILLTPSGTQAIDLLCRHLLRPGDTVVVDDPCYFNFQALLRAHRVKMVGVPYTTGGPDPAEFAAVLTAHRPRLYITNSALHNPTGASLTPQAAHRLLVAAAEHDLTIIEDDIFADFETSPSPRLAVLDGLARVIRIGSFSKTLSASVRCGYIAAQPEQIEALVDLQLAISFGGSGLLANELVLTVLSDGSYRRHLEAIRPRLAKARSEVSARLEGLGIRTWVMPRGGFNLWCELPDGLDSGDVARRALADGLVLAPGNVFSVSQSANRFMRFNVTHMREPAVFEKLARALRA